jgi:cytidylate kinase
MHASVICISRTAVAGGETLGMVVAQHLGFRYFDDEVIQLAADKAKVDLALIDQVEHRQPILKRVIDALGGPISREPPPEGYYAASINVLSRPAPEALRALIRATIGEIADRGRAVIVAHAASFALADRTDVLRVFVTASLSTRVERLSALNLRGVDDPAATVRKSDREREEYLRHFYNVREELPTHYDLVVNTDHLTADQAVQAVLAVARG